jgi:murein L,D-transpeptidase YcbB/YkuD
MALVGTRIWGMSGNPDSAGPVPDRSSRRLRNDLATNEAIVFTPPTIARAGIAARIAARIAGCRRPGPRGWAARGATAIAGAGALAAIAVAVASVVAGGLTAAGAGAEVPGNGGTMLLPASLQPADPAAGASRATPGDSEIRSRIEGAAGFVIGGEKLHLSLLRQFYAAHNFEPVWAARPAQADALLGAVSRAGEHGLDPDLFHAALLRNPASLPPVDRELLLSDGFLAYADALARGAVPIELRMDDEDQTPEPIAVAAALDNALNSPNPAAVIEALAPNSPDYMALRRALQSYPWGAADGRALPPDAGQEGQRQAYRPAQRIPADTTPEQTNEARLRQIAVALERLRWLPRNVPADRVWVNIANARLVLYQGDRPVFTTRVVVGEVDKQTPEFQTTIDSLLFNPPWNVPVSIASKEILPKLARDPNYLTRHHMVTRGNGAIQQLPGAGTALGQLKFEMQDRFDVYLHDTPLKNLFSRDNRRQSHGCVRVQNPRELAALLLQHPVEVINKGIALGYTNRRMLPAPVPVFLVYQTAFAGADGAIEFRPDVYQRDEDVWQQLHPARQAPVAQHESTGQRRG